MASKVVFYALSQKFLEREEDMPAAAKQVMYYTLAVGHHIGVIDCLKQVLACPLDGYQNWIARLPEGEARRKLEGLLRFGEINIDATHIHMLGAALDGIKPLLKAEEAEWSASLMRALAAIEAEPAMYLMVRRRDD
ncbi:formate hydrogenlyase maturation HycH family protein [Uliginosibacterium gangwonense]|uniref:formate hydrogenlyase maturation HycH family protein n=1 Tax=Uliginosibacterium gangwonense TaxID=392736 RepID=UPI0003774845|nr:formate hydrogenlyase maturation HycH family protein [Uliginosibacterium gangwonense]